MSKKILVLGLGVSGKSAAKFVHKKERNAQIYGFDENFSLKEIQEFENEEFKFLDETIDFNQYQFDLVVVSPGYSPKSKHYAAAVQAGIEIISEIELGLRAIKNPLIAVTGTNGKTTVTLLIEHVLNHSGIKSSSVGNIGQPLTAFLLENDDEKEILVVELSSYQLERTFSKSFDAAVILNITPDHLERYNTFSDYALQKIKLKDCLRQDCTLYVNEMTFNEFQPLLCAFPVKIFQHLKCSLLQDLRQEGHDLENMMAAYAMVQAFGVTENQFLQAFATFKKPAHRIEFVRRHRGVEYYDDSKGTNVDAVLRAVTSLKGPIYLIAGGVDKGSSYAPWKEAFKGKVKQVFTIGQAAYKIKNELSSAIDVTVCETLELAVVQASSLAVIGDIVLLSPGCSSFDMFKDYKERGDAFQKIVHFLED